MKSSQKTARITIKKTRNLTMKKNETDFEE
jgi:hypothetical protein